MTPLSYRCDGTEKENNIRTSVSRDASGSEAMVDVSNVHTEMPSLLSESERLMYGIERRIERLERRYGLRITSNIDYKKSTGGGIE